MSDQPNVEPGLSDREKALANALIATATADPLNTDQEVASAAAALLAGAICGMLGLGGEETTPEEYNEYANYIHTRIEEAALALIAEIAAPESPAQ